MLKRQYAINILLKKLHILYLITSSKVRCRYRDLSMHDDGGDNNDSSGVLSIFTHPIRFHGRGKTKLLDPNDHQIAHRYVLMNCSEVEPYRRRFISQLDSVVPASLPRHQLDALPKRNFQYSSNNT